MSRQPRRLGRALVFMVAAVVVAASWPVLAPDTAPRPLVEMVDGVWRGARLAPPSRRSIEIAVAVDHPGIDGRNSSIVKGARLLAAEVNAAGGIAGQPLEIVVHDDGGEPGAGQTIAEWIATETEAVAVIGHRLSEIATPAGAVYAAEGLPAITPTATAPAVTAGNPWYFRSVADDAFLARFLAQYLKTVIDPGLTVVVLGDHGKGARLAAAFVEAADEVGLKLAGPMAADLAGADAGATVGRVVSALQSTEGEAALLLASYPAEAAALMTAMRAAGLDDEVTVLGSATVEDAASDRDVGMLPADAGRAAVHPEGMVLATPVVLDAAAGAAGAFRDAYVRRYGEAPDWQAASAYDAAEAIAEAIRRSGAAALGVSIADMRGAIRDRLAAMDSAAKGVAGVTGPLFFDTHGNPRTFPSVALYRDGAWLSAFNQFQVAGQAPAAGSPGRVVVTESLLPPALVGPAFLIASAVFLVTLTAGAAGRGRTALIRALVQFLSFCVLLAAGQDLLLGLLDGRAPPAARDVVESLVASAWPLALAGYAAFAVNRFVWPPLEAHTSLVVPRPIRRLVGAAALLFGICAVIAVGLDRPAAGLFAAAILAVAIVGAAFAARVTDAVAALALCAEPAFAVGDWVRIGELPAAKVTGLTWRIVRLHDAAGRGYSVSNGKAASLPVANLSATRPVRDSITVYTTPEAPPTTVLKLIKESLENCSQIERDGGYGATLCGLEITERMMVMTYSAWYHVTDLDDCPQARQEVWLNVWERLESEGFGSLPDQTAAEEPAAEEPVAKGLMAERRSA